MSAELSALPRVHRAQWWHVDRHDRPRAAGGYVEGVLIPLDAAEGVVALVEHGCRWARANGLSLTPEVAGVVNALEDVARALRVQRARRDVRGSVSGRPQGAVSVMVSPMSTAEYALAAGCSQRHASRLAAEGRMGARRVGGRWAFDRSQAELALDGKRIDA